MKKDTKILIKFIIMIVCACGAGFVLGIASTVYEQSLAQLLETAMIKITLFSPVCIYLAVGLMLWAYVDYIHGKKAVITAISSTEEEDYDAADNLLENALIKVSYATVLGFTALGAMVSGFSGLYRMNNFKFVLPAIIAFFALLIGVTILQSVVVKQVKLLNPEKKGNTLDRKFQKEWLDSCDEAERVMIGKAAYASYSATSKVLVIGFLVLSCASFVLPLGPLPVIVIGVIWFVQSYSYFKVCKENRKN